MLRNKPYSYALAISLFAGLVAVVGALVLDLPLRDPDGVAGPSYIRLPAIVVGALLADILPRAWYRTPRMIDFFQTAWIITRQRWSWARLRLVVIGLGCFYISYVAYRNIKSFLPSVTDPWADGPLAALDKALFLGNRPGTVLHDVLGEGLAAHVLSWIYVVYLFFVPITLAAALVWTTHVRKGFFYVTALCLNWVLGVASYYVLPAYGPRYFPSQQGQFFDLPETGVNSLQKGLLDARNFVISDPQGTDAVYGIAAFASLHVSVVFTAALVAHRLGLHAWMRWTLWVYLAGTALATIYFGWHYLADDVGGVLIGYVSVAIGAMAVGYERPWGLGRIHDDSDVPVPGIHDDDDEAADVGSTSAETEPSRDSADTHS